MPRRLQFLIAEDNADDARLLLRALQRAGFDFDHQIVDSETEYLAHLRPDLDVVLSDYEMPQFGGLRALEQLKERGLEIPFIIISGTIGEEQAVAAMKLGAADYLLKDRLARLGPAVTQAIEQGRMRKERHRTAEALRESEERFRQVVQNIEEVFWMTNLDMTEILFVSAAYERIWGRTCASLYTEPRGWVDAIHPDDRDRIHEAAGAWKTRGSFHEDYRIVRPDGSIRWISDRAFPVRNAEGEVFRLAGVAEDITQRRLAREELQLFRNLVDQSTDTFEIIDPETARYLDVSAKGPMELGCSRDEYLALHVFDIDPAISPADWGRVVEQMRRNGAILGEGAHLRKDGSSFPIEFNAKLVRLDRDYVVATIRDITERQRAEQRVHELAAMLDLAHDAIFVRRFADQVITFWNQGAERLYGWTSEEAIGRSVVDLIFSNPEKLEVIETSLRQKDEWRGENKQVAKNGRSITVSTRATLVRDPQGKPDSVLVINTDITEQKELELRFLRAQRMESIGTLAAGVAHDLNNILSPILMSAPLLRRNLPPEVRDEIIETVEMSANRGAQIVKQVLTFGRGVEGERRPMQIASVIKELLKIMFETFPKDILVDSSLPNDLWLVVGDATQLHQVLLNLCINARDAMPRGGELSVSVCNVELDETYASMLPGATPGPNVLLEVRDQGTGMPPEIRERIFDPFFTTKEPGKGTGLGLSTVLGIVKSHGGHIGVKSEPGEGTTFQIHLPAVRDAAETGAGTAPDGPPLGHGECVLVVDDEERVRKSAKLVLETHGYTSLVASDGIDALATFAKHHGTIAVVLTDLMMPHMDGVAFIHAIRRIKPHVPIIASTGLGTKKHLEELKQMRINALLTKPYGVESLLCTIRDALSGTPSDPPV